MDYSLCGAVMDEGVLDSITERTIRLLEQEFSIKTNDVEVFIENLEASKSLYDITLASSISGGVNINLIFSFEKKLSKFILDSFPYVKYEPEDELEMIFETAGEVLNIVIGNAMSDLKKFGSISFSTPMEFFGSKEFILNKKIKACIVRLITKHGSMFIIFSTKKEH